MLGTFCVCVDKYCMCTTQSLVHQMCVSMTHMNSSEVRTLNGNQRKPGSERKKVNVGPEQFRHILSIWVDGVVI